MAPRMQPPLTPVSQAALKQLVVIATGLFLVQILSFSVLLSRLPRKRVEKFLHHQLFGHLVLNKLVLNVLFYRLLVSPHRIHVVSSTPELSVAMGSKNKHFKWFARLLENHFEGITAHGTYRISTGKVEETNNLIKTVRRAYRNRDNDYFFIKILDESRREYVRNSKSHKLYD